MLISSTLCYIESRGKYLMLFRNKKEADPCEGKWVGIGGKFEAGETADTCVVREVREETGLVLQNLRPRGVVHFKSNELPDEDMFLYTAELPDGVSEEEAAGFDCDEGELEWIPKEEVGDLNLWEGDIYFLEKLAADEDGIEMTCIYEGDRLVEVK